MAAVTRSAMARDSRPAKTCEISTMARPMADEASNGSVQEMGTTPSCRRVAMSPTERASRSSRQTGTASAWLSRRSARTSERPRRWRRFFDADSPLPMLAAERAHRAHAIVEQVIADLENGPLAHLPSGQFWANSAWLVCAAMAFNLTRTAGTLASTFHAKATTGTIRAQLITVPRRFARSARRLTLHLPTGWPWQTAWHQLATAANSPPLAA